ncbi:DUF3293 domain-containing protein [Leptospira yasudae]|uniref:DUF3293 domain-containing protein n=1 Tax=Leptospira yasudae TaxID=2202201 RepID=UPI0010917515|nr:DUF3293 domain-containing protein [Leptospira yasudae]TGN00676.1 DUF3293 domain-containing protein [Leptospira yasudae]
MDEKLRNEYLNTRYTAYLREESKGADITEPSALIEILAETFNPKLDELLNRRGQIEWAFITAWNPKSLVLSLEENQRRNRELENRISSYSYFRGKGIGTDPSWVPEESFLILGMDMRSACDLGKEFGQNAIIFGKKGDRSQLIELM